MLATLPGWIVDDEASVRQEVAPWIGLSAAELWRLAILCGRDAMWAVQVSGRRAQILDRVDPLPESAAAALARMRRRVGWGNGDH